MSRTYDIVDPDRENSGNRSIVAHLASGLGMLTSMFPMQQFYCSRDPLSKPCLSQSCHRAS
jgi:hypothetical protein